MAGQIKFTGDQSVRLRFLNLKRWKKTGLNTDGPHTETLGIRNNAGTVTKKIWHSREAKMKMTQVEYIRMGPGIAGGQEGDHRREHWGLTRIT